MHFFPSRWISSFSRTRPSADEDFLATSTQAWWQMKGKAPARAAKPDSMGSIRQHMCQLLQDCPDGAKTLVIRSLNRAVTPHEAWMLRSNIFQCIARCHGELEARDRVNRLIPHFQPVLPAARLRPV